jgi:hypothetical protein
VRSTLHERPAATSHTSQAHPSFWGRENISIAHKRMAHTLSYHMAGCARYRSTWHYVRIGKPNRYHP